MLKELTRAAAAAAVEVEVMGVRVLAVALAAAVVEEGLFAAAGKARRQKRGIKQSCFED